MSAWIVALLREAYDRLPPPATNEARLAYFMRRKRDLEDGFKDGMRARDIHTPTGFSKVADTDIDAAFQRLCADEPEAKLDWWQR